MKKRGFIMLYVLLFGALLILTLGYLDRGAKVDNAVNRNEWEAMETYYRGEAAIRVTYEEHVDEYVDGLIHKTAFYIGGGIRSYKLSDYLSDAEDTVANWRSKIYAQQGGTFELEIFIPELRVRGTVRLLDPYFLSDARLTKEEVRDTFNMYYHLLKNEEDYGDDLATREESEETQTATTDEQEMKKNFETSKTRIHYIPKGKTYVVPKNACGIYIVDGKITGEAFRGMIFDSRNRGIPRGFYGGYFTPQTRTFRLTTDGARRSYLEAGSPLPGFLEPKLQSIVRSK